MKRPKAHHLCAFSYLCGLCVNESSHFRPANQHLPPPLRICESGATMPGSSDTWRIAHIALDQDTILWRNADVEQERRVAIYDLIEENTF